MRESIEPDLAKLGPSTRAEEESDQELNVYQAELKVAHEKVSALALAHEKSERAPARRSILGSRSRFRSLIFFFSLI